MERRPRLYRTAPPPLTTEQRIAALEQGGTGGTPVKWEATGDVRIR